MAETGTLRVIFFGSGTFALPSVEAIRQAGYDLAAVVTQPARRAGRGGKPRRTVIAEAAEQVGIPVFEFPDVNAPQAIAEIEAFGSDINVVVEYGQFLSKPIRQSARLDTFNLHASVLPSLRGAGPVNWAIINGLTETGVSTFSLVKEMDAGPVYLSQSCPIPPTMRADELREQLSVRGSLLVLETVHLLETGQAAPREQETATVSFAPKLTKTDGHLDFAQPAKRVNQIIRGTWPWPGGQAVLHREKEAPLPVLVARAQVLEGRENLSPGVLDEHLRVTCGKNSLAISEIKPAGKRLMDWKSFVNGYRVKPGDRFEHPGSES